MTGRRPRVAPTLPLPSGVPLLAACLVLLLPLAGCTAGADQPAEAPAPFAACDTLTAPPQATPGGTAPPQATPGGTAPPKATPGGTAYASSAPPAASAHGGSPAPAAAGVAPRTDIAPSADTARVVRATRAARLPDLTLPCFTGGRPVRLAELRGPALVNLWGTWCGPCRTELPVVQRLADRTVGRLHVVGVNTRDSRNAGGSFAADKKITIATLYDSDMRLMQALGIANLPATALLDGAGHGYIYTGPPLDDASIVALVQARLGVAVDS